MTAPGIKIGTRQKAHRLGHSAEWRAAWRLRLTGWQILARRYKTRVGEIDIVARRGRVLAFVEVKARRDAERAGDSLSDRQFGRTARAAGLFLAHHPRHADCAVRFDAVLVSGIWPRHLPDVWQPPE